MSFSFAVSKILSASSKLLPASLGVAITALQEARVADTRVCLTGEALYIGDRTLEPGFLTRHLLKGGILDVTVKRGASWVDLLRFAVTRQPNPSVSINMQISPDVINLIRHGGWLGDILAVFRSNWADLSVRHCQTLSGVHIHQIVIDTDPIIGVVPVTEDGKIILTQIYRRLTDHKWSWEIPKGYLDPKEDYVVCARREVMEETGAEVGEVTPLIRIYPSNGISRQQFHLYLGRVTRFQPRTSNLGEPDEGEDIAKTEAFNLEDAIEMICSGQITDASTVVGILLAQQILSRKK